MTGPGASPSGTAAGTAARARPHARHGRRQRHPRLVLRRRPVVRRPGAAVAHGLELLAQGADLLDVGGESTRPGARARAGRRRAAPACCRWSSELVARGAVGERRHHARRGRRARPSTRGAVDRQRRLGRPGRPGDGRRRRRHRRRRTSRCTGAGTPTSWTTSTTYDDVVTDVRRELAERVDGAARRRGARRAGRARPGPRLRQAGQRATGRCSRGCPSSWPTGSRCWSGASRKRFLGHLLAGPDGEPGAAARAGPAPRPR